MLHIFQMGSQVPAEEAATHVTPPFATLQAQCPWPQRCAGQPASQNLLFIRQTRQINAELLYISVHLHVRVDDEHQTCHQKFCTFDGAQATYLNTQRLAAQSQLLPCVLRQGCQQ
jgi:hypothetical protein